MDLQIIFDLDIWKQYYPNYNKHYITRYLNFCKTIYNKGDRDLDYCEKHHIIPIGTKSKMNTIRKICITNGIENKYITCNELENYIFAGWWKGSKTKGQKFSDETKRLMSKSRKDYCNKNRENVLLHIQYMNERKLEKNGIVDKERC